MGIRKRKSLSEGEKKRDTKMLSPKNRLEIVEIINHVLYLIEGYDSTCSNTSQCLLIATLSLRCLASFPRA